MIQVEYIRIESIYIAYKNLINQFDRLNLVDNELS